MKIIVIPRQKKTKCAVCGCIFKYDKLPAVCPECNTTITKEVAK